MQRMISAIVRGRNAFLLSGLLMVICTDALITVVDLTVCECFKSKL